MHWAKQKIDIFVWMLVMNVVDELLSQIATHTSNNNEVFASVLIQRNGCDI
jgi:hypothetical protein